MSLAWCAGVRRRQQCAASLCRTTPWMISGRSLAAGKRVVRSAASAASEPSLPSINGVRRHRSACDGGEEERPAERTEYADRSTLGAAAIHGANVLGWLLGPTRR